MVSLSSFFGSVLSSGNNKALNKFKNIVETIIDLESKFENKDQSQIIEYVQKLKLEAQNGKSLNELLPESFALVREASKRTLDQRHFDVQLIGGQILHNGSIAEMKTGEGKTLVSTLPAFLNSLNEKGVHIVTVNDYLAKRDSEWMGSVFKYLGLSVGCITNDLNDTDERKKAYLCDITYGTNNEFGFDYLRDNLRIQKENMVQRSHNYCIVDCLLYTSPSPRDTSSSRMPSSA